MNIKPIESYGRMLSEIMNDLDSDLAHLREESQHYKDRAYLRELVDIVYGSTDLNGKAESRVEDLEATKIMINNIEVIL